MLIITNSLLYKMKKKIDLYLPTCLFCPDTELLAFICELIIGRSFME